jgi:hypothetical protein
MRSAVTREREQSCEYFAQQLPSEGSRQIGASGAPHKSASRRPKLTVAIQCVRRAVITVSIDPPRVARSTVARAAFRGLKATPSPKCLQDARVWLMFDVSQQPYGCGSVYIGHVNRSRS